MRGGWTGTQCTCMDTDRATESPETDDPRPVSDTAADPDCDAASEVVCVPGFAALVASVPVDDDPSQPLQESLPGASLRVVAVRARSCIKSSEVGA